VAGLQRPTLDAFQAAQARLVDVATHTPLVPLHSFDNRRDIYLKLETHQPINSFKIRGVFNAVAALPEEQRAAGLSTTSAGNTAQALAWCGRYFGVTARAIMPETAPRTKIAAVEAYGGTPVLVPGPEVFRFMRERGWEQEPYAFIHPWVDPMLHAGHGTLGLEVINDLPEVETVFIPVGGGGLIAGVGSALKALKPSVRIVAVEPAGCPALEQSLLADHATSVECRTICDGTAVPFITEELFPLLRDLVDDIVLVSDDDVRAAMRRLASGNKIIAEGAGALATAAALTPPVGTRNPSVAIVTGGSIDMPLLLEILGEG
jgi:threonine dehydratase